MTTMSLFLIHISESLWRSHSSKVQKIEDWATDQLNDLNDKVTRANNPVGRDEEILWTEFKNAFTRAFTDTTQKQQAYRELHALRMQGSDLDTYISKFKHLAKKAGYDEAADATIDMFAKRLNRALLDKILDVKTHCLLRAAVSLMQGKDKGSEGGRRRWRDVRQWRQRAPQQAVVVCGRDQ